LLAINRTRVKYAIDVKKELRPAGANEDIAWRHGLPPKRHEHFFRVRCFTMRQENQFDKTSSLILPKQDEVWSSSQLKPAAELVLSRKRKPNAQENSTNQESQTPAERRRRTA
jgi:hypothetical protein